MPGRDRGATCNIDRRVAVSSSEEMNEVVDAEGEGLRPSGERPLRQSGSPTAPPPAVEPAPPTVRPPAPMGDPFDDVTPTRSLVEVGLADMDEDLPTRMQALDELARFRTAAAD